MLAFDADDDALGVDRIHDAVALGQDDGAGVARGDAFHAGADQRSLGNQQRHGLALHVGAHQRAVRVVVLEERHQRCGDRDELLRADVDVVDLGAVDEHEVALTARIDQLFGDAALRRRARCWPARWCDDPLPTRRDRRRTASKSIVALACLLQLGVQLDRFGLLEVVADTQAAFAGVGDLNVVEHARVLARCGKATR